MIPKYYWIALVINDHSEVVEYVEVYVLIKEQNLIAVDLQKMVITWMMVATEVLL